MNEIFKEPEDFKNWQETVKTNGQMYKWIKWNFINEKHSGFKLKYQ